MMLSFLAYQQMCTVYREMPGRAGSFFFFFKPLREPIRRFGGCPALFPRTKIFPDTIFPSGVSPLTDIFVSKETPASAHFHQAELHTTSPDPFLFELDVAQTISSPKLCQKSFQVQCRGVCVR